VGLHYFSWAREELNLRPHAYQANIVIGSAPVSVDNQQLVIWRNPLSAAQRWAALIVCVTAIVTTRFRDVKAVVAHGQRSSVLINLVRQPLEWPR
jgi:hypothetical protein